MSLPPCLFNQEKRGEQIENCRNLLPDESSNEKISFTEFQDAPGNQILPYVSFYIPIN
jgi:hypothetical protein